MLTDSTFTEMIATVWRRRIFVGFCVFIAFLAGTAHLLQSYTSANSYTTSFITLQGIIDKKYPNKTAFSPADLKHPKVINQLAIQMGIEDVTGLENAISIQNGSPTTEFVIEKYRQKLKNRRLSVAQIDKLNKDFAEELKLTTEFSLQLTVLHENLGVSANAGKLIASTLPKIWNTIFVEQFGVSSTYDPAKIPAAIDFSRPSEIISFVEPLSQIKRDLLYLAENPNLNAIRSEKYEQNAFELLAKWNAFETGIFNPILYSLITNGNAHANHLLFELKTERDANFKQIAYKEHVLEMLFNQATSQQAGQTTSNFGIQTENSNPVQLAVGDLNRILELTKTIERNELITTTLEELDTIRGRNRPLEKIISAKTYSNSNGPTIDIEYANDTLLSVLDFSENYFETVRANPRSTDLLFDMTAPASTKSNIDTKYFGLTLVLYITVGLIIGLVTSIVTPVKNENSPI